MSRGRLLGWEEVVGTQWDRSSFRLGEDPWDVPLRDQAVSSSGFSGSHPPVDAGAVDADEPGDR